MKELKELLNKENLEGLTQEEKTLIEKLFDKCVYDDEIVDFRYEFNDKNFVEVYGARIENDDETIFEIDFSKNNYFRFFNEDEGQVEYERFFEILREEELTQLNKECLIEFKNDYLENYNEEQKCCIFECENIEGCYDILEKLEGVGMFIDEKIKGITYRYISSYELENTIDLFSYVIDENFELKIWLDLID